MARMLRTDIELSHPTEMFLDAEHWSVYNSSREKDHAHR